MATNWKLNNPDKLIWSFDPQLNFRQIADKFLFMHDTGWGHKLRSLRNCLLVLDDYRLIHPKNQCSKELAELLNFRAAWNVDIIYICHSPNLVLNTLTYYTTHYFIFATYAQAGSFEKKIPSYNLCNNACQYINKYVKFFGKGQYPNFPYIIVDVQNEKLIAQNMDIELFKQALDNEKNNSKQLTNGNLK